MKKHVLLIGPEIEENLSLRYLAAALNRAGHQATLATFNSKNDVSSVLAQALASDIVGLSMSFQGRAMEFVELARSIKSQNQNILIVAGGHFASCAAEELLKNFPAIDIIAIHEAEGTLVEIANAQQLADEAKNISGIAYRDADKIVFTTRRPMIEDLDSLPFPERCGPKRETMGVGIACLMGSRGCLNNCQYCCISTLHKMAPGKMFRQRSTGNIADEMAELYHKNDVRLFVFHDDNFLVPSKKMNMNRIESLEKHLKKRSVNLDDIGLTLKCRPVDVNKTVFEKLKDMNLLRVFLGIETGSTAGLCSIGRNNQTMEDAEKALRVCEELGISTQYTIMLFHPEATPATMLEDLAFVRRHAEHPMNFCRTEIYAGTPLEQKMIAAGRAVGNYMGRAYSFTDETTGLLWLLLANILRRRCWGPNALLHAGIGLDYLMAVQREFFPGPNTSMINAAFSTWQLAVTLDTVDILERVISLCQQFKDVRDPTLSSTLDEISAVERANFRTFSNQAKMFFDQFNRLRQEQGLFLTHHKESSRRNAAYLAVSMAQVAALLLSVNLAGCGDIEKKAERNTSPAKPGREVLVTEMIPTPIPTPTPGTSNGTPKKPATGPVVVNETAPGPVVVNETAPGPIVVNETAPGPIDVTVCETAPSPIQVNETAPAPVGFHLFDDDED